MTTMAGLAADIAAEAVEALSVPQMIQPVADFEPKRNVP
jgi:hypothetical protein